MSGGTTTTTGSTSNCVDASFVVRALDATAYPGVQPAWDRLTRPGSQLIAPALLRYEVANVLRLQQRAGKITDEMAFDGLSRVLSLPIEIHGDVHLHVRALALASDHGLPAAYDAHYLALAERFGTPFWTCDARLAKAVGDRLPWVHLVS